MPGVIDNSLSHVRNNTTDEAMVSSIGATIYINGEIDLQTLDNLEGDVIEDQTLEVVKYEKNYAVIKLRSKKPVTIQQ